MTEWFYCVTCFENVSLFLLKIYNNIKLYHHTSSETQQTFVLMKTSFVIVFRRRLQDVLVKTNIFALAIRLQDVLARRLQDIFKTSSRRLAQMSSRRFQDVLKTSSKSFQDLFKKSSRRLQDIFKTSCKVIFKTFSRHIIKLICSS